MIIFKFNHAIQFFTIILLADMQTEESLVENEMELVFFLLLSISSMPKESPNICMKLAD